MIIIFISITNAISNTDNVKQDFKWYVNVYFVRRNTHGVSRVNLIQILLITHVSHMWRTENRRSVSVTLYIYYYENFIIFFDISWKRVNEDYNIKWMINSSLFFFLIEIDILILIRWKRFLFTYQFNDMIPEIECRWLLKFNLDIDPKMQLSYKYNGGASLFRLCFVLWNTSCLKFFSIRTWNCESRFSCQSLVVELET